MLIPGAALRCLRKRGGRVRRRRARESVLLRPRSRYNTKPNAGASIVRTELAAASGVQADCTVGPRTSTLISSRNLFFRINSFGFFAPPASDRK